MRELGALVLADRDIGEILVELVLIDDRADMHARLHRVVDDEAAHALGERVGETRVDAFGDDQPRGGRAALAGGEIGAVDRAFDRRLQVRVVEHDERVLAAHFELELAHPRGAGRGDALAGRDRAGEGDRVDMGVIEHRLADHRAAAHHEIEDALRRRRRAR